MKRLVLPALVLASLVAGAGAAAAFRDKPKFAESGYHAVVVRGVVTLSDRGIDDWYWNARPVNEALIQLVGKGLVPVQATSLDDDTVLLLFKRAAR